MRVRHRRVHLVIWIVLSAMLPLILIAPLALRHNGPREVAPVRLDTPAR